jgi:hypothetical protein
VTIETRNKLLRVRRKAGVSLGEILRQGLGLVETNVNEAFERGLREGWGRFETPCVRCGKPIRIDIKIHLDAKKVLEEAFRLRNWGHRTCNRGTGSE